MREQLAQQPVETLFPRMAGQDAQYFPHPLIGSGAGNDIRAGTGEQLGGHGVVQHLETGRQPRFHGKHLQQLLAEGVNGLHLQPAGRLQRPGEEPARVIERFVGKADIVPHLGADGLAQGIVILVDPVR